MVTLVEGTPVRVAFKYRLHPVLHPRGTIQLYADWPGVMLSSLLGLPRVRVHRFKNGSIAVMRPGSADQFIAREILLWNIYRIRDSEIKEDDVVLDVGAHIGLFTLFVHRLVPKGRILAIEPDPDNFHMLKENIARNGLGNVTPLNLALTGDAKEREKKLFRTRANTGANSTCWVPERFLRDHVMVNTATMEDVMNQNGVKRVDILKMDCEGAEHEILEQLPDSVMMGLREMVIEWHRIDAHHDSRCLANTLRGHGFDVTVTTSVASGAVGYIYATRGKTR